MVEKPTFIILGASLDTGNLGVSALLAGTVKSIRQVQPDAGVYLLEGSRNPTRQTIRFADGQQWEIGRVGVRFNKTIWRHNHIIRLLLSAVFARCLPSSWRARWLRRNPCLKAIVSAKAVMDITGGDSFTDLYGLRRLIFGTLDKYLVLLTGAKLILLPQTYGPFKSRLGRCLARVVIRRAGAVYCRDMEGLDQIRGLMGRRKMKAQPQFCPDVAFVLDPIPPTAVRVLPGPLPIRGSKVLVGFNVSGLLWNGGYTHNNMFGLKTDYPGLVRSLIKEILRNSDAVVLLVPHVFPESDLAVESDPQACRRISDELVGQYPGRLFHLDGSYDQNEIKSIIGQCDFFLGSRMHACIAAVSQYIPTMALAYSKKFRGVFESIETGDSVVDLRACGLQDVLDRMGSQLAGRTEIALRLRRTMHAVQSRVDRTFVEMIASSSARMKDL